MVVELCFSWASGCGKCCLSHFEDSFLSAGGSHHSRRFQVTDTGRGRDQSGPGPVEHTGDEHHHGDGLSLRRCLSLWDGSAYLKGSLQYHNSQEKQLKVQILPMRPTWRVILQPHSLQNLTFQKASLLRCNILLLLETVPSVSAWILTNNKVTPLPI